MSMRLVEMKYILLLFCTVFAISVSAQTGSVQSSDTTNITKKENKVAAPRNGYRAGNYGFNAAERWAMQDRYRGIDSVKYSLKNILSHLYFGLSVDMKQIAERKEFAFEPGQSFGIIVGKDLNKIHALSLLGEVGSHSFKSGANELKTYSLQLNHHFNFTRYYLGYNPYRALELSSSVGVGVQKNELVSLSSEETGLQGNDELAKFIHLGLLANVRLDSRLFLSLEPHVVLGTESYNGAPAGYWYSKYNMAYGVRGSLNYELRNELHANIYADKIIFPQNYMFLTGGLQASDASIGTDNTLGAYFNFGFGHWFAKRLALQVSAGYASGAWKEIITPANAEEMTPEYRYMPRTQYAFGRLEAVANVFKTGKEKDKLNNSISLNLLGGYEYGFQWKYEEQGSIEQTNCWYGGPTAALQLKYHSVEGKALFLEPRVSFINYEVPYKPPYSHIKEKFSDARYSLALGMEFGIMPELSASRTAVANDNDSMPAKRRFTPEISLFAGAGTNYMFERGYYDGDSRLNMTYSLGAEYQPFAPLGIRFMYDYSNYAFNSHARYAIAANDKLSYKVGLWQKNYYVGSGIIDAKIDLTNIFYGYQPGRKWNTAAYVGPIFSKFSIIDSKIYDGETILEDAEIKMTQEKSEDMFIGVHAALNTRYNITPALGIFGEWGVKAYGNKFLTEALDYNPIRAISMQLGVNYRMQQNNIFAKENIEAIKQPVNYMFIAPGMQLNNSSVDFAKNFGPYVSLGVGRWLTKNLALQVSGGYSNSTWHKATTPANEIEGSPEYNYYSRRQQAFGRIEAVTNLFTTINDSTSIGGKFSINLLGGYEVGKLWKYLTNEAELQQNLSYSGLTGALQFKFHSVEGKSLFLEPRVSLINYTQTAVAPFEGFKEGKTDVLYSMALGMEFGTPSRNNVARENESEEEFTPEISLFAGAGTNYLFERAYYDGASRINTTMSAGIEYQPFKNFGARLMLDRSTYNFNTISGLKMVANNEISYSKALWNKQYNVTSTILDVKFDITNMLYGYRADRRWNTAIYVGPMLSKHSYMDAEVDDSETMPEGSEVRITKHAPTGTFWGVHAALNTRYNITPAWGVFGELGLKAYGNDFMVEMLDYNPIRAISMQLGANYRMQQSRLFTSDRTNKIMQPAGYMFFETGMQGDNSSVSLAKNMGASISLGAGRWLNNRFGVQVSGGYSNSNWHETVTPANELAGHPEYIYYSKTQNFYGRLEAVTNLFTTIKERNDIAGKFSLNLSGGYEFGKMWKYLTNETELQQNMSYGGLTGALQFKFHSLEGKSLYIQPRVTVANYNARDNYPFDEFKKQYTDVRYSLAVGMEYGTVSTEEKKKQNSTFAIFLPELSFYASTGTSYMFERGFYGGDARFNKAFTLGVELQPGSKIGGRVSLDYSNYAFNVVQGYQEKVQGGTYHYNGLFAKNYNVLSGIFDVKLDMMNILSGYNPDRKWETAIYTGPIISKHLKKSVELHKDELRLPGSTLHVDKNAPKGIFFGWHTAFNTGYRINKAWSIFGEMGLKIYKNDFITEPYIDYNPMRAITWQLGVKYNVK